MRIAMFTEVFVPKVDGITNRLSHTIGCLTARGNQVLVFAPSGSPEEHRGARVVRVPGLPFPPYPGLEIALPHPAIVDDLRRFAPDVVHAVGPACLGVWGMLAARALGLPIVASYHTDLPAYLPLHGLKALQPLAWPLLRRVHNMADLNLCPSIATRTQLEEHGIERVGLWRGGVDCELFHPERRSIVMRSALSDGEIERPLLLYVGRVAPEKNLRALRPVLEKLPEARLAIVGDGPDRSALEEFFRDSPVCFTGTLHGEDLASAFASADVFTMPSKTETLGFVALEAMSAGCPVVGADAMGIASLVRHGETGLLCDVDDVEAFTGAIRALLEDRFLARELAAGGRAFAEQASWDHETRALFWNYRGAIRRYWRGSLRRRARHALWPVRYA